MPAALPIIALSAVSTIIGVGTQLVQGILTGTQQQNRSVASRDQRRKRNITATTSYIPIVYGRFRVGGLRVFADTALAYRGTEKVEGATVDTRGDYLYLCTILSEGPIEGVDEVFFDGVNVKDPKFKNRYQVDVTLKWSFPDPSSELAFSSITLAYKDLNEEESTVSFRKRGKFILRRVRVSDGKLRTIFNRVSKADDPITIDQQYTITNTQYGEYIFTLVYEEANGITTTVGRAQVIIAEDNGDFQQIINENLTVTQDSVLQGGYILSESRVGGDDNNMPVGFMVDESDIDYDSNRFGFRLAYLCHRLLKHTKGYTRPDQSPIQDVPIITSEITGKKVFDSREFPVQNPFIEDTWEYSNNPINCISDYLRVARYGKGLPNHRIDRAYNDTQANFCDELVTRPDGRQTKRYTCNGIVESSQTIGDNVLEMLTCCNGRLTKINGRYRIIILKPEPSTNRIDMTNIVGDVQIVAAGIRTKNNYIKAQWFNPKINYEPDFIEIQSEAFRQQDGRDLISDIVLPFTTDYDEARTLATIALKNSRLSNAFTLSTDITTFDIAVGDVITLNHPPSGILEDILVRVTKTTVTTGSDGILIKYELDQYDEAVFEVEDYDEEPALLPSTIDEDYNVSPPSNFSAIEGSELDINSNLVSTLRLSWFPSKSLNIRKYQIDYKVFADGSWIFAGETASNGLSLLNFPRGDYQFRIKAINSLGVESVYIETEIDVQGFIQAPPDVRNFELKNNNRVVSLSWKAMPEVANYGFFFIKHIPSIAPTASWLDLPTFVQRVEGNVTETAFAQIEGTYMIKAVNQYGVESPNPAVLVLDLPDDNSVMTVATAKEDPDWDGQKTGTVKSGVSLITSSGGLFDARPGLFDDADGNFDYGFFGYSKYGSYDFANSVDLGAVFKVRLRKIIQAIITQEGVNFEQAEGIFDEREGFFDGMVSSNVQVNFLYRSTNQDPNDPDVQYSDWTLLTEDEATGRAFLFRLEIFKLLNDTQITIEQGRVDVQLSRRQELGNALVASGSQLVSFTRSFYELESLLVVINDADSGDYHRITSQDKDGFRITLFSSGGAPISGKNIVYTAQGIGEEIIIS